MANEAKTRNKLAIPVLEQFQAVNQTVVAVTTTALALPAANGAYRKALMVKNSSTTLTLYLGGSDVTAGTTAGTGGFQLGPGDYITMTLDGSATLYGRTASGTIQVCCLEFT